MTYKRNTDGPDVCHQSGCDGHLRPDTAEMFACDRCGKAWAMSSEGWRPLTGWAENGDGSYSPKLGPVLPEPEYFKLTPH